VPGMLLIKKRRGAAAGWTKGSKGRGSRKDRRECGAKLRKKRGDRGIEVAQETGALVSLSKVLAARESYSQKRKKERRRKEKNWKKEKRRCHQGCRFQEKEQWLGLVRQDKSRLTQLQEGYPKNKNPGGSRQISKKERH